MTKPPLPYAARWQRWAAAAVLAAVGQFVVISAGAMSAYPGGNPFDPRAPGHSFWRNTISDLAGPTAVNGQPNRVWATLFAASLVLAFAGLALLWLALPSLFKPPADRRHASGRIAWAIVALGTLSVAGAFLVAGSLAAGFAEGHRIGIGLASVPGLGALTLTCLGLARNRRPALAAWSVFLMAVGLLHFSQYVAHFWLGRPWTPAAPATQKVAVMTALLWMAASALAIMRRPGVPAESAPD